MTEGTEEQKNIDPQTMDAGRALDTLIAERVMGFRRVSVPADAHGKNAGTTLVPPEFDERTYRWSPLGKYDEAAFVPKYSFDIAHAWLVVEALRRRGWLLELHAEGGRSNQWRAYFHEDDTDDFIGADTAEYLSPDAILAICRAAVDAAAQLEINR